MSTTAFNATSVLQIVAQGDLSSIDPHSTPGYSDGKSAAEKLLRARGHVLADLQERLYAAGRTGDNRAVLLVIQGMDTAGKGGIVRHVMGMVDPQGVSHASFGKPTKEELDHDFLWRIRKQIPQPGQIGVFDRSHYEDVLVVRVHDLVPAQQWQARYDTINNFERELTESGITVVKTMLHISYGEQRKRLSKRLHRPDKYWKYNPGDIDERRYWDQYQQAYQALLDATNSAAAPWYVVPADRKWYARLAITELLINALAGLDLTWPEADFDVKKERARLART